MSDETEETLEMSTDTPLDRRGAILKAIENLSNRFSTLENRFDRFEKNNNAQLEAIREGLVHNSASFDRLEATVFSSRSDVANLRADVKELSEEIRQVKSVV